jgi:hypothetical protein
MSPRAKPDRGVPDPGWGRGELETSELDAGVRLNADVESVESLEADAPALVDTHAAGSRNWRLLARAPEPQRSPEPNSSEPRLLGVDLLALLFDRGGAG